MSESEKKCGKVWSFAEKCLPLWPKVEFIRHAEMTMKTKIKQVGLSVEMDRTQFAVELKTWRIRQGLTQQQLGERWGMSRYTILRVEKAKPCNWQTAYRLFAKLSQEMRKEGGVEL